MGRVGGEAGEDSGRRDEQLVSKSGGSQGWPVEGRRWAIRGLRDWRWESGGLTCRGRRQLNGSYALDIHDIHLLIGVAEVVQCLSHAACADCGEAQRWTRLFESPLVVRGYINNYILLSRLLHPLCLFQPTQVLHLYTYG